jgi:2-oxoglutarate dehydrogenase E1 component
MSKLLRLGRSMSASNRAAATRTTLSTLLNNNNNTNNTNNSARRLLFTSRLLSQQQQPATPPQSDATTTTTKAENFLNGSSAVYIDEIYASWLADPKSVHKSWDIYFRTNSVQTPPTLGLSSAAAIPSQPVAAADLNTLVKLLQQQVLSPPSNKYSSSSLVPSSPEEKLVEDHLKLYALIRSYQIRGHKKANLDPLGIGRSLDVTNEKVQDLTPEFYNFTETDLSREFKLPATTFIGGSAEQTLTLKEILNRLNSVYSRSIGLEYMYINNFDKCNWIRQQFETPGAGVLTAEEKKRTLKRLIRATRFEEFLAKKWSSEKRFGLEGIESI